MFNKRLFFTPLEILDLGYDIRDPGWVKIRIRDKHPGSATLTHGNFSEILFDINFCFLSDRAERRPATSWPRSICCSRRRGHPPRPPPPRCPPRSRPAAAAAAALHYYVILPAAHQECYMFPLSLMAKISFGGVANGNRSPF